MHPIVILGTGLAGYGAARELRKHDRTTPLILVTRDDGASYYKPDLSEAFTRGQAPDDLVKKPVEAMAEELDAEVRTHAEVTAIDPAARAVIVNGEALAYRDLVLANGARPVSVPLAGDAAVEIHQVNNLQDYRVFRRDLEGAKRIAILGAGLIGCEFANDLANAGIGVHNIDPIDWPLQRFLPEAPGRALEAALADLGVHWHLGATVEGVQRSGDGFELALSEGRDLYADLVLSAIGLQPDTALAEVAGLRVDYGVTVDRELHTSDPHIYALGDAAEVEGRVLPFVLPLMNAARALGKTLAGEATPVRYPVMPVIVKTPACPVIVYPPRAQDGKWRVSGEAPDLEARYLDSDGRLDGFALTGAATGKRRDYIREAPPVLP
jgi:rubredoxin-NAD+ reductase